MPFIGELNAAQRRLLEAVMVAHQRSAVENGNVSSEVFRNAVSGSGSFRQAVCAGILSTGGPHAPIAQARAVFESGTVEAIEKAISAGKKVPGFGNSFYKGRMDPAWESVLGILAEDFINAYLRLCNLSRPIGDKKVLPNAAMFTAIACHICGIPHGLEDSLFMVSRIPAWADMTQPSPLPSANKVFQIVGLPRSGTAFLSVMFSLAEECETFHELAATDREWKKTLAKAHEQHRYVADCTTYGFLPGAIIPESRKVFIERPWRESRLAAEEAIKIAISEDHYSKLSVTASHWADEWQALRVSYADPWNMDSLRSIWDHCFEGMVEFPTRKVSHLLTMNVQRMNPERVFGAESLIGKENELSKLWDS